MTEQRIVKYTWDTDFEVPADVSSIVIKSWGAGGGGSSSGNIVGTGHGGGGGFAQATLAVTPGETLTIRPGGGGEGGKLVTANPGGGGGGGGFSGVFRGAVNQANCLVLAGGGGGGGQHAPNDPPPVVPAFAGAGGGTTGVDGDVQPEGGRAGTQTEGGKSGDGIGASGTPGTALQGGNGYPASGAALPNAGGGGRNGGGDGSHSGSFNAGGGGGGGYYGGGGGAFDGTYNFQLTCGGGGSGFVTGTATTLTQGSGQTPANTGDPDYEANTGVGGDGGATLGSLGEDGGTGLIVLIYDSAFEPPDPDGQPTGMSFDATNFLTRGSDLTGNADGKKFTFSLWFLAPAAGAGTNRDIIQNANQRVRVRLDASNRVNIRLRNTANANVTLFRTNGGITHDVWNHACGSFNAETGETHLYLNDVADLDDLGSINDFIEFTRNNHSLAARETAATPFNGDLADVWVSFTDFIDLSVVANRRKVIGENASYSVKLGDNGELVTGSSPIIFFRTTADDIPGFATNKGTGGGYTPQGTQVKSPTNPPDYAEPPLAVTGNQTFPRFGQAGVVGVTIPPYDVNADQTFPGLGQEATVDAPIDPGVVLAEQTFPRLGQEAAVGVSLPSFGVLADQTFPKLGQQAFVQGEEPEAGGGLYPRIRRRRR